MLNGCISKSMDYVVSSAAMNLTIWNIMVGWCNDILVDKEVMSHHLVDKSRLLSIPLKLEISNR